MVETNGIFPGVFRVFLCETACQWKSLERGGSGEGMPRVGIEPATSTAQMLMAKGPIVCEIDGAACRST